MLDINFWNRSKKFRTPKYIKRPRFQNFKISRIQITKASYPKILILDRSLGQITVLEKGSLLQHPECKFE